jgi:hypothetical protein
MRALVAFPLTCSSLASAQSCGSNWKRNAKMHDTNAAVAKGRDLQLPAAIAQLLRVAQS